MFILARLAGLVVASLLGSGASTLMLIALLATSTVSEARDKTAGSAAASAACKLKLNECKTCTEGRLVCAAICRDAKKLCFPTSK